MLNDLSGVRRQPVRHLALRVVHTCIWGDDQPYALTVVPDGRQEWFDPCRRHSLRVRHVSPASWMVIGEHGPVLVCVEQHLVSLVLVGVQCCHQGFVIILYDPAGIVAP